MSAAGIYQFPADRAVVIIHDTYGTEQDRRGLIAIVAPTTTPGTSHVGILDVRGKWRRFIHGPARMKTGKAWKWLDRHDDIWSCCNAYEEAADSDWSTPAATPDDFIDIVTGRDSA